MWYVMFNYEFDLKLYVVKFVYLRVFILYLGVEKFCFFIFLSNIELVFNYVIKEF